MTRTSVWPGRHGRYQNKSIFPLKSLVFVVPQSIVETFYRVNDSCTFGTQQTQTVGQYKSRLYHQYQSVHKGDQNTSVYIGIDH